MSELTIQELFAPLVEALPEQYRAEVQRIIGLTPSGVLAWGVRSGYLLWMRTHPGVTPTPDQIREWMKASGL